MKCLICGADVPAGRYVYCSELCAKRAEKIRAHNREGRHTTPAEAVCPICGKVFAPKPNEKYCSCECRCLAIRLRKKAERQAKPKPGYSVKKCETCGKEFKPASGTQKCCSTECSKGKERENRKSPAVLVKKKTPTPGKPFAEWCREAAECNLDYGTYRALITSGKTFEELKALAGSRGVQIHAHGRVHKAG